MPSPDFEAAYTSLDTCVGWWAELSLKNTGTIPFKSIGITVQDRDTDMVLVNFMDGFTNINGCLPSHTRNTLGLDKTYVISAPAFNYDLTGYRHRVTIILCSDTGQRGTFATETITTHQREPTICREQTANAKRHWRFGVWAVVERL